jgi:hypothetical protein
MRADLLVYGRGPEQIYGKGLEDAPRVPPHGIGGQGPSSPVAPTRVPFDLCPVTETARILGARTKKVST